MSEPPAPAFDSLNTLVRNLGEPLIYSEQDDQLEPYLAVSNSPCLEIKQPPIRHYHRKSPSIETSKSRRSLATLAREKTSTLASIAAGGTTPTAPLRTTSSSTTLTRSPSSAAQLGRPKVARSSTTPCEVAAPVSSHRMSNVPLLPHDNNRFSAISQMSTADKSHARMHQTSSKILRMTDDDRPFCRDFKDLFSTLITSLPLTPHRVRFTRVEETFLSEEAIANLGSLKFSQSNRIPDPKNPSRWVVTTTTTTFSMAREMARTVCQRFIDARFIESAESKSQTHFVAKGGVWQLTPKGIAILHRFCSRNGIVARHIDALLKREQMHIVSLERDHETDRLSQDKATVEIIFRRFMGHDGPNIKSSTSVSDNDSVSEYTTGLVGVKMAKERRVLEKVVANTFTGKAASDWLLDCCTTVDRRETFEIAELFINRGLMASVVDDRNYLRLYPGSVLFQPTKYAVYTVTEKGQRLCGWLGRPISLSSEDSQQEVKEKKQLPKDSNVNRLNAILQDPALRLLFKEFLRVSLCEENLHFYLDVHDFTANYRYLEKSGRLTKPESVRETLAAAYGLYNSFLASGAPSELNIDHALRNRLDTRMIRTDADEESMRQSLEEVVELFELAQSAVFKLMASDSVPKFIRDTRYTTVLREHESDVSSTSSTLSTVPEKPLSRSSTTRV